MGRRAKPAVHDDAGGADGGGRPDEADENEDGDAEEGAEPPRKLQRLGDAGDGSSASGDRPPRAPLTRITALVGRNSLGQARTGTPPKRAAAPPAPPTPASATRSSPNPSAFVLRAAARAARTSTVAEIIRHWVRPAEWDVAASAIMTRFASQREAKEVLRLQDDNCFLLSAAALAAASIAADGTARANGSADPTVPVVETMPTDEARVVIEVVLAAGAGPRRLPHAALRDMLAVHLCNRDFLFALQSKSWLNTLLVPDILAPLADSFLMPIAADVPDMVATVRSALGPALPSDTVWERKVTELVIGSSGSSDVRDITHRLSVRELLDVARPVWMQCSFIDCFLVELARSGLDWNSSVHVLLCDKFTALLRTPQGHSVQLSAAHELAQRWAYGVGSCQSVVTLVNHGNKHWCAARVWLDKCTVEFYDPSPSRDEEDATTRFSMSRLKLLGNVILDTRGGSHAPAAGRVWGETYVKSPTQADMVSCGAFCLQFVASVVVGSSPDLGGDEADVLRLALVHKMVHAGGLLREQGRGAAMMVTE